MTVCIG